MFFNVKTYTSRPQEQDFVKGHNRFSSVYFYLRFFMVLVKYNDPSLYLLVVAVAVRWLQRFFQEVQTQLVDGWLEEVILHQTNTNTTWREQERTEMKHWITKGLFTKCTKSSLAHLSSFITSTKCASLFSRKFLERSGRIAEWSLLPPPSAVRLPAQLLSFSCSLSHRDDWLTPTRSSHRGLNSPFRVLGLRPAGNCAKETELKSRSLGIRLQRTGSKRFIRSGIWLHWSLGRFIKMNQFKRAIHPGISSTADH